MKKNSGEGHSPLPGGEGDTPPLGASFSSPLIFFTSRRLWLHAVTFVVRYYQHSIGFTFSVKLISKHHTGTSSHQEMVSLLGFNGIFNIMSSCHGQSMTAMAINTGSRNKTERPQAAQGFFYHSHFPLPKITPPARFQSSGISLQTQSDITHYAVQSTFVWLGGRVVRTLDLRSIDREFESWPLRYRVQPWASC